jgi:benzoate transport
LSGNRNQATATARLSFADRPMSAQQIAVVALCVLINTIDGFDILAISFAAPAIVREWGLTPERTGFMLSSGLAGIGIGALLSSFVADAIGRRPVILFGSLLIAIGMLATAFVHSVGMMALCRVVSGLGIGCMVSTVGTLAIEYSSHRWRTLSVALVVLGFPLGGTLGGPVAVWLLEHHGWRSLFVFGASLSLLIFPLLLFRLPESIEFLVDRQPRNALAKINRLASRFSLPQLAALPPRPTAAEGGGYRDLARPPLRHVTIWICLAYFCYMFSFYFIQSWATSLVTKAGLSDAAGVTTSAVMNFAGLFGGTLAGYLATRMSLARLLRVLMLLVAALIAVFGWLPPQLWVIYLASAALGFVMWGASATVYSAYALSYPPRLRASGIGMVVTAGRAGSILGPYVAGVLLTMGMQVATVTALLAIPAVVAALMFGRMRLDTPND